jgi:hypothetical protein
VVQSYLWFRFVTVKTAHNIKVTILEIAFRVPCPQDITSDLLFKLTVIGLRPAGIDVEDFKLKGIKAVLSYASIHILGTARVGEPIRAFSVLNESWGIPKLVAI